ncbi:MAG TPA: flagellar protein FlbB [Xanthobacteraceae bacterium]|nr:flagellar protein FlbB [Xanthobacteraceae bacterium]
MIRYIRDLRLIPIALIASACLLVLKIADLALDGGRWWAADHAPMNESGTTVIRTSPDAPQPPGAKLSWAQQMFNFPGGTGVTPEGGITPAERAKADRGNTAVVNPDITGSIATTPAAGTPAPAGAPGAPAQVGKPAPSPDGVVIPTSDVSQPSGAERAILERLAQRRQELDARARELDIRESLVKAAEQRIDAHLAEIKEVEARIKTETVQKDQAEAARFKGLVTMYENMKPRDAAKIFDGLDMDVLIQVVSQINPRAMADIMGQMAPEMAERLTVALASKAQETVKNDPAELPKIQGKPTTP